MIIKISDTPHKTIALFLGYPVSLVLENFKYNEHGEITTQELIWRDDKGCVPAFINIRACIWIALENFMFRDKTRIYTMKEILEPGEKVSLRGKLDWREKPCYSISHNCYNKYLNLLGEEKKVNFNDWAKIQLGLFIIRFHHELLTEKEKFEVVDLKMDQKKRFTNRN